jgi:triacylglycerol lipase
VTARALPRSLAGIRSGARCAKGTGFLAGRIRCRVVTLLPSAVGYEVTAVLPVCPSLEVASLIPGPDATGCTWRRDDMAPPALITRLLDPTLVNQRETLGLVGRLMAGAGSRAHLSVSWHLPFHRQARVLADDQAVPGHLIGQNLPVHLAGLPVLVVGGLATSPHVLNPLQDWLRRIGCHTLLVPTQYGIACGQRAAIAVEHALMRHVDATGKQAVIIAYSRGGQFARPVAVRRPELVRGLITLGSPLTRLLGAHPIVLLKVLGLGVVGSLGVPGLFRASCLWGDCCRPLRDDLMGPFPDDVPFLSVFSRQDEVVPWETSLDPAARHREICTTHHGLIASPAAFQLLAQELTLLANQGADPGLTSRA